MAGRVFVTGGSGFVGRAILSRLLSNGYSANALVNQKKLDLSGDIRSIPGGLFDDAALNEGMHGCDAVIHLVGIIMENPSQEITFERIHFEGTRRVVDAAKRNGVKRFVQMSAIGARADAPSQYHKTKFKAEEYVRASGLDWTIFRPSMILGADGEFTKQQVKWARKQAPPFLFMPYFGAGLLGMGHQFNVQPVDVDDIARAFVEALSNEKSIGKTYALTGSEMLTWPQMHKTLARAVLGRDRLALPIPAWYAAMLTKILPASLLPFNHDQVLMSQEDNTGDNTEFKTDFGWTPAGYSQALSLYALKL
jgi:NADH dehydrogenase